MSGFGDAGFGVYEFGIDEEGQLSEIWLDFLNGSDETGDGSEEHPIKTVANLLLIMGEGATIYFVNIPKGQPDYIYQLADSVFWDLEK